MQYLCRSGLDSFWGEEKKLLLFRFAQGVIK
jgi:hypothetical protein